MLTGRIQDARKAFHDAEGLSAGGERNATRQRPRASG